MADDELPDWDRIVERHANRVFRVAQRILGSVQDAEEISQDVFTEAFQMHQRGPIQSWTGLLVRLATLRSIDRLRRNRPSVELRESDRISTTEPFDEFAAKELCNGCERPWLNFPTSRPQYLRCFTLSNCRETKLRKLWEYHWNLSRQPSTRPASACCHNLPFSTAEIRYEPPKSSPRFREPRAAFGCRSPSGINRTPPRRGG